MAKHIKNHEEEEAVRKIMRASINYALVEKQKLTDEQLDEVIELHTRLHFVKRKMEALDPSVFHNRIEIQDYGKLVEEFEFALQEAWGFNKDRNYHSHWYTLPHCSCPVLDNRDNYGTEYRIIRTNCVVHGEINDVN